MAKVPFESNVLATSATFQSSAVEADVRLTASTQVVQSETLDRDTLTIGYNAATGSYALSFNGRTATFDAGERLEGRFRGETQFVGTTPTNGTEFLTIYSLPFVSGSYATDIGFNRYVAQGYWQVNEAAGPDAQATRFTSFVFGQRTPGAAVPRTGAAHWLVDIFGALSRGGSELRTVVGDGDFQVDFASGAYQVESNVGEADFLSTSGAVGSLFFTSGGLLRADGTFGGPFSYEGTVQLDGTLEGAFFGPAGEEVGATFEASNGSAWLSGAFTGQRSTFASTSGGIPNISLTNLLGDARLFADGSRVFQIDISATEAGTSAGRFGPGRVDLGPGGVSLVTGQAESYAPVEAERIADPTGAFDRYRKVYGNNAYYNEVALYRGSAASAPVQLTYLSFVRFDTVGGTDLASATQSATLYFPFGIVTSPRLLSAMTGTANYTGVVYARGVQRNQSQFELGGTTAIRIDFTGGQTSGELVLNGLAQGGLAQDSGRWTFAHAGVLGTASLVGSIAEPSSGSITPMLYGPTGQELAAPFFLTIGMDPENPLYTQIAGIGVAH